MRSAGDSIHRDGGEDGDRFGSRALGRWLLRSCDWYIATEPMLWRAALGLLALAVLRLAAAASDCAEEQLVQLLRKRFEQRFADRCMSLPLVREHFARRPTANASALRGASFVLFADASRGRPSRLGGLGDRLAGLVSVFYWSLRQGRALLLDDPQAVAAELFAPLPPTGRIADGDGAADSDDSGGAGERCHRTAGPVSFFERRRRQRPVSGGVAAAAQGVAHDVFCVNPRPRDAACVFETDADADTAWLRVRHNRAYLCRWLTAPSAAQRQLLGLRQGAAGVDLALWSGCALRLMLWPRAALWRRLAALLRRHTSVLWAAATSGSSSMAPPQLLRHLDDAVEVVGLHFRCGDHRFDELREVSSPDAHFRRCASHSANGSFAGAAPLGEWASAAPSDVAACAVGLDMSVDAAPLRVYVVASDADDAVLEMARELRQRHAASRPRQNALLVALPRGGHFDGDASRVAMQQTLVSWTLLALCDGLAVQAVDCGDETRPTASEAPQMVSAFSRSALWFGLGGASGGAVGDGVAFASRRESRCRRAPPSANATVATAFSLRSQGNWRCDAP